jgi:hypothetical protein
MVDHIIRFIGMLLMVVLWTAFIGGGLRPAPPPPPPKSKVKPRPTATPSPTPILVFSAEDREFLEALNN